MNLLDGGNLIEILSKGDKSNNKEIEETETIKYNVNNNNQPLLK